MPRRIVGALVVLLLLAPLSCRSDAERAEQGRLMNLAERIDRLRRADNRDKRELLDGLKRTECVGSDACGLKDLCVRAYQMHQQALDAIEALKKLATGDAGPSPAVRERLRITEQNLSDAQKLGQECADQQVRAVRKTLL